MASCVVILTLATSLKTYLLAASNYIHIAHYASSYDKLLSHS
jgi:hypothetical protein